MNYDELIHIKYNVYRVFIILVIIAIIISIYITRIEIYDVYNIKGYIKNSSLVLNIPIEHSDTIINGEYLIIDEQKYEFKIANISDVLLTNNINYQEIVLNIDNNLFENSIVDIAIYHDKEKVGTKLKEIVLGG